MIADAVRVCYYCFMNLRSTVFILAIALLTAFPISANEPEYFYLAQEPLIRIGLSTNSSRVYYDRRHRL
jgi:hypothetical protein